MGVNIGLNGSREQKLFWGFCSNPRKLLVYVLKKSPEPGKAGKWKVMPNSGKREPEPGASSTKNLELLV